MTTPAGRLELESATRLRDVVGRLYRRFRQNQDGGLTPALLSAMATIETSGPIKLSDLADREGVHRATLSRTVAWLIEHDLVHREVSTTDRRSATVSLTIDGEKLLEMLRERRTAQFANRIEALTPQQRVDLVRALPLLEALLETYTD